MWKFLLILTFALFLNATGYGESVQTRIFVVSSYHGEYLWSQSTHD